MSQNMNSENVLFNVPTAITTTSTANIGSGNVILCNSATAITLNLPAASTMANRQVRVKNINIGVVTIDANASETIDGQLTYALTFQWQAVDLVCNGTSWYLV